MFLFTYLFIYFKGSFHSRNLCASKTESDLSLPLGQRCRSCSGQGSSDHTPQPKQTQGHPLHVTSPRPCKSLLCKAVPSASGTAAEALTPAGVSPPEKMKMTVTVPDRSRSEGPGFVSHTSFFFYQRVTEAGLALATLDPEDLR